MSMIDKCWHERLLADGYFPVTPLLSRPEAIRQRVLLMAEDLGTVYVLHANPANPNEWVVCREDEEFLTCWCGVRGHFEDLFDEAGLEEACGGLGMLHCFCGGDQCVCHHHGETPCHGCIDCREDDDEDLYGDDEE